MTITFERVVVSRTQIAALFKPGVGQVARECKDWADETADIARRKAPKRTGELAESIRVEQGRSGGGQFSSTYWARASAEHALWVHDGTDGSISNPDNPMRVPKSRGPRRGAVLPDIAVFFPESVRGQRANPFLTRAADEMARKKRL